MTQPVEPVVQAPPVSAVTFEESFPELKRSGYRVAYRILGSHEEAEDVAQEAAARAYSRWRRIRGYARPWVCRVAGNLAIDVARRRDRMDSTGETGVHDPDVALRLDLQKALAALPKRQREVVTLRYLADLPIEDVATTLRCAPGTVKRSAHLGIAKLRETFHLETPGDLETPDDLPPTDNLEDLS